MKFDICCTNEMIIWKENGLFTVLITLPPDWSIQKLENLTYEEVLKLPNITEEKIKNAIKFL